MHKYKELIVWKKAIDLTLEVYRVTAKFPDDEKFGLISQARRSSVSVAANIAEGAGRKSANEFNHFLSIASGSASETFTHMFIAQKLGFVSDEDMIKIEDLSNSIHNMIFKFQENLKS